jgi:hypothetical protein
MRMSSSGGGPRAAPVIPLSQVSDLQAALTAQSPHGAADAYSQQQYDVPVSQANSVLDGEAYMQVRVCWSASCTQGYAPATTVTIAYLGSTTAVYMM